MGQPAPGWFPDPFDPARRRWWDGRQWTTHLHPAVGDPAPTASDPGSLTSGAPHRRTRVATVALVTAGALLVGAATATAAGLLAFVPSSQGGGSQAGPVAPTTTATTPAGATALQGARASPTAAVRPSASAVATAAPSSPSPKASAPTASPAGLVPVVSVTDGDTIRVRVGGVTERVRVIGLDTPELRTDECYAQQAASRMQSLVQSTRVRLTRDPTQGDRDRFGRLLRHVALADGRQVAEILIVGGFGEEFTYDRAYAGQAAYRSAERAARDARRGIWSSGCSAPDKATASGSCLIKGNITGDGERIYHVPGQRYYEDTRITLSKGERWFCTEQQARDAGWRASKV
ncbi:MAG TPA: thermonuclease family protein [Ornithinibacter sp.]|nr:thermonuclease family protein [Ornithinibacter sp.]